MWYYATYCTDTPIIYILYYINNGLVQYDTEVINSLMIRGTYAVVNLIQISLQQHKNEVKSHWRCSVKHMLTCFVEILPLKRILPLNLNLGFFRGNSEWLDNNIRKHHHILTIYCSSGLFLLEGEAYSHAGVSAGFGEG